MCGHAYLADEGSACWDCRPWAAPTGYWEALAKDGIVPQSAADYRSTLEKFKNSLRTDHDRDPVVLAVCPLCDTESLGLTAHGVDCMRDWRGDRDDVLVSASDGSLPQAWISRNQRGEVVINGTVLRHKP